jgi:hypothetical protein
MQLLEIVQNVLQSKTLTPTSEAEINQILRGEQISDPGMQALGLLMEALREGQIQRIDNLELE